VIARVYNYKCMKPWDAYLENLDSNKKSLVIDVLTTAKSFAKDAVEAMPYGVPGLRLMGKPLIAVAAHKEHLGVYPFSPSVIKSAKDLLGNCETAEGTIRFQYGTRPRKELIEKLVELRAVEIEGL
jgi:uncharacterized protein YdhG (YjbR/CyaY superfamily)